MPANLTPQYKKAEEKYRKAQTPREQVECLEEMMQLIPKHKGTEKLQADLKSRLKEARDELGAEKKAPKKGKKVRIPHQGAGQVILVGGPNAGKSRIVAELTNAQPEVADYPFTTHEPVPAMMPWEDVMVQLVDTPPIAEGHLEPYMSSLIRSADAVLLCMDGGSDDAPDETEAILKLLENRKTILAVESGFDEENFAIFKIRTLLVVTRADDPGVRDRLEYFRALVLTPFDVHLAELDRPESVEELRDVIYRLLEVVRVYTKAPGKPAEYKDPFTLSAGGTVHDLAEKVHKDIADSLRFAKIWGTAVHDGQSVGPEHVLHEKDLVELHAAK